jgi:hypothetical protein
MEYVDLTPEQSEAGEENSIFAMILPPQYFANFNDPLEPELVAYYCLVPGDANGNGAVTISDAIYIINIIFFGFDPVWPGEPDADASGGLSIGDAVYLINYIFGGGPAPTCYL